MTKHDKLFEKALNNPYGLSFESFKTLLRRCGWIQKRCRGSHEIWSSPNGKILSVQDKNGKAKGYQVEQFLKQYREEFPNA